MIGGTSIVLVTACAGVEAAPVGTPSVEPGDAGEPPPGEPLARPKSLCVGAETLPIEPPHDFVCCHPALDAYRRVFAAAASGLRRCYETSTAHDRSVRVGFVFRIEADGAVGRVCSDAGTTLDDDASLSCMLGEVRRLRFPASSSADVAHCGLVSLTYPTRFDP